MPGLLFPIGNMVAEPLPEFDDRRREPRFSCDAIPARVQTDAGSIPARVVNISTSGVRLEVMTALPVLSEATVSFNNIVAAGEVRYCQANRDESFDVGLQIQDVIHTA
jgi:hypothetical protein